MSLNQIYNNTNYQNNRIITMATEGQDECPFQYFFVVEGKNDKDNKPLFCVMKRFNISYYDSSSGKTKGQYLSSINYQVKNKVGDSLQFYIVAKDKKTTSTRKYIQSIFNDNITDIYHKTDAVYHFHVPCSFLENEYSKLKIDFANSNSKYERSVFNVVSVDGKCCLSLHMLITKEYLDEKSYLLNNPSFKIY